LGNASRIYIKNSFVAVLLVGSDIDTS